MRKSVSALFLVLAALVGSAGTGATASDAPAAAAGDDAAMAADADASAEAEVPADVDGADGRSVFLVYSSDERSELVPCG